MSAEQAYTNTTATNIPTTTETAVGTFTVAAENQPTGQGLLLNAAINFTPGTATTAVTVRIRQGVGTGGAVVGVPYTTPVTAGVANSNAECLVLDPQVSYPAGNTYTVTAQQVAATGNGTMAQCLLDCAPVTSFGGA